MSALYHILRNVDSSFVLFFNTPNQSNAISYEEQRAAVIARGAERYAAAGGGDDNIEEAVKLFDESDKKDE